MRKRLLATAALSTGLALVGLLWVWPASAHVKWFADFSFGDRPLTVGEVLTPTLIGLLVLSAVMMAVLVFLDRKLDHAAWYRSMQRALEQRRDASYDVIRIGVGAVMLLNWQADAMLVPELTVEAAWIGWYQFAIALLLLTRKTSPVAGAALIGLYIIGLLQFGAFHMLDYPFYAGAGFYLLVARLPYRGIAGTALPVLYLTVGFSLCWVALEKLIYPQWGLYILEQNPQLSLGFDIDFFLTAAAMVEFSLGFILIIGLLERPFAAVITLVFFMTTLVFGKLEIIGHTLLHAALIVFLLEGPGSTYRPPYAFHRKLSLRMAFASVNIVLLFVLLFAPYAYGAWWHYEQQEHHAETPTEEAEHTHRETDAAEAAAR